MSANLQNFVRTTANTNRKDINKILEALQDLFAAPVEDEASHERIVKRKHVKRLTESHTDGGATEIITNTPRDREDFELIRKKPVTVKSYPLVHTTTGTPTFSTSDTRNAGRVDFGGSDYITVTDNTQLKPTDKISIVGFFYVPAGLGNQDYIRKGLATPSYVLRVRTNEDMRFRINTSVAQYTHDESFTKDQWNSFGLTWSNTSNLLKAYLNGSEVSGGGISTSGNLTTNTDDLGIGHKGDGTNIVGNGVRMAWVTILHAEVSSGWITNFHSNTLLDTSDGNDEILTIPFIGSEGPKPNATSGLCRST